MQHRGITAWIARLAVIGILALAAVPLAGGASAQNAPAVKIVSPSDGATVASNDIVVQVEVSNFNVNCAQSGAADQDGTGQILAFVDGATIAQLTNIYCTDTFTISGQGLTPGQHQIAIVLASNTHAPMMDTAQSVTIDYQPAQPIPLPVANYTGDPAVTLVSPQDGATVPPVFEVQVQPQNFAPTTALEGKMNVPGYGHYHVWVDAPEMPDSLAGLVLMPGTNAFTLDLSAWGEGQHTVRIEIAQNDHTMYDPQTSVTFTVNVSASATPVPSASPAASPAA
jgi:Rieske Fe-S protein